MANPSIGPWLLRPRLRVGITGLSGAGKTSFILSLINQLENFAQPELAQRRGLENLRAVRWQPDGHEPAFPYREALGRVTAQPPRWPESTRASSLAHVDLQVRPATWLGRRLRRQRDLALELADYPGEWLLDLILLDQDHAGFSRVMNEVLDHSADPAARDWRRVMQHVDPDQADSDSGEALERLASIYADVLRRLRSGPEQRRLLLPGRMLLPDSGPGGAIGSFVPLPPPARTQPEPGSLRSLCEQHFTEYREQVARRFYADQFRHLDAQVVLIDLLGAMRGGRAALEDLRTIFERLVLIFRYGGRPGLLQRLRPRIHRVVIVTTQVDHILPEDQENLLRCMQDLLFDVIANIRQLGVDVRVRAVSALRCALPVATEHGPGLLALRREDGRRLRYLPPRIPAHLPGDLDIRIDSMPDLAPPSGLRRADGFPNFRMAEVLEDLLGEWLQDRA